MKTILVVDNDAPLSWLLERLLRAKYIVKTFNNGFDAWDWVHEGRDCDLILCDVNMPELSGIELLENLKADDSLSHIPVIMLSGLDDHKQECMALGAHDYVLKPFEPRNLLTIISKATERHISQVA